MSEHHKFRYLLPPGTNFQFVAKFKTWLVLSCLLMAVSIATLFINKAVRGEYMNWTIDFKGGSAFLPFEIKPAVTVEYRRHHRKYPLVGLPNVRVCHNHLPVFELLAFYRAAPAGGAFSRPRHVAAGH